MAKKDSQFNSTSVTASSPKSSKNANRSFNADDGSVLAGTNIRWGTM